MARACCWTKVLEDGARDSADWRIRVFYPLLDRPKACFCLDDVHGSGSPSSVSCPDPSSLRSSVPGCSLFPQYISVSHGEYHLFHLASGSYRELSLLRVP